MATRKKSDNEEIAETERELKIAELRSFGLSWRDIEENTGINYETARQAHKRAKKRILKQHSDFKMAEYLAEERVRFDALLREAFLGWLRSVGEKQKTTSEIKGGVIKKPKYGKDKKGKKRDPEDDFDEEGFEIELPSEVDQALDQLASMGETKDVTVTWHDAGDPRFLQTMKDIMVERNRVFGVYDKDRDKGDDDIDLVQFQQHVYIPGLEMLTPELIKQLYQSGVIPPMPEDHNG